MKITMHIPSDRRFAIAFASLLLSFSAQASDVGIETLKIANANLEACATGMKTVLANYKPDAVTADLKRAVKTGEAVQSLSAVERAVYSELVGHARLCAVARMGHGAVTKHLADLAKAGKALAAEHEAEMEKLNSLLQSTGQAMGSAIKLEGFAELMFRVMNGKG